MSQIQLLSQCLVGENVYGDGCGEGQEKDSEDKAVGDEEGAVQQSYPDKAY